MEVTYKINAKEINKLKLTKNSLIACDWDFNDRKSYLTVNGIRVLRGATCAHIYQAIIKIQAKGLGILSESDQKRIS